MAEVDEVRARPELIAALDELLATAAKRQAVLVAVSDRTSSPRCCGRPPPPGSSAGTISISGRARNCGTDRVARPVALIGRALRMRVAFRSEARMGTPSERCP